MNILIISTSDIKGGAAIAAYRLLNALKGKGENVKMVVKDKLSNNPDVISVGSPYKKSWNFYYERGMIFLNNKLSRKNLFSVSIANTGESITDLDEFKNADIIHLHWINQGMLSLKEIKRILSSGKKIIWTMHDMWSFTGVCHHAGECTNYEATCGKCPYLGSSSTNDLSSRVFQQKKNIYSLSSIHFVGVSNWIASKAAKSLLTAGHFIEVIPNAIDTDIFSPKEQTINTDGACKTIIMGADRLDSPIKGFEYLRKALQILVSKENKVNKDAIKLLLFGSIKDRSALFRDIPVNFEYMGRIDDAEKVAELYRNAHAVVVPSLYETFGQTIIEGMSCGLPAISFNNSGQTDIIAHKENGYLARYKDVQDLADGIYWTLFEGDSQKLSRNAREKVINHYSGDIIAEQYIRAYSEL